MRNLPKKKGYARHVDALGEDLYAVEHVRGEGYNVAVVVCQDGRYFIGQAILNPIDVYCRRLGHEIAVGRALHAAVSHPGDYDGRLWDKAGEELVGRDLGSECRRVAHDYGL